MAFLATTQNRANLKVRLLFSVLSAFFATLIFEGFNYYYNEAYSFSWVEILTRFILNMIGLIIASYYFLKSKNVS